MSGHEPSELLAELDPFVYSCGIKSWLSPQYDIRLCNFRTTVCRYDTLA
jgi:hypothetical protein